MADYQSLPSSSLDQIDDFLQNNYVWDNIGGTGVPQVSPLPDPGQLVQTRYTPEKQGLESVDQSTRYIPEQQALRSVDQSVGLKRKRDHSKVDFSEYRDELQAFYQAHSLRKLMLHMREKYGIDLNEAEWKTKFKALGLAKNVTRRDYAHVAHWCLMAGEGRRKVVVKVRGVPKTIADVSLYLQKDTRKNRPTIDDLVYEVQGEELPDHITVEYLEAPGGNARLMSHGSRIHPGLSTDLVDADQYSQRPACNSSGPLPYGRTSSRSDYSEGLSSYRSESFHDATSDTTSVQSSVTTVPSFQRNTSIRRDTISEEQGLASAQAFDAFRCCVETLITGVRKPHQDWPAEDIFAALSTTPRLPNKRRIRSFSKTPGLGSRRAISGRSPTRPVDLTIDTQDDAATLFVTRAHIACISRGQNNLRQANEIMDLAQESIECLVRSRPDQVLPIMNLLTALFESYGQGKYGLEVLDLAFTTWKRLRGGDESLCDSVRLMKDGLNWTKATDDLVRRLERVHTAFIVTWGGDKSISAMAVKWQIAWALASRKRYVEAEEYLVDLRAKCETAGGVFFTSIMVDATYARVRFRRGHLDEARGIMAQVTKRLGAVLPTYHPYYLESLTRQARFLQELKEPEEAERILRTVLESRYRILGPNNRKSRETFNQLQNLLKGLGRERDADGLWETMRWRDSFHQ